MLMKHFKEDIPLCGAIFSFADDLLCCPIECSVCCVLKNADFTFFLYSASWAPLHSVLLFMLVHVTSSMGRLCGEDPLVN